ncbi:hypothetical protein [Nostoc sp. 'Peltigera malacea cyanobiont' DB3992]|uniref:hypothetical protein n=1 Tax=Nostoc sp. 'Peltigera malacea cyanobiont' DB3992 TaxID=1206980 RepID=UPI00211E0EEF|nr:hypothetical protein [Nostoc sp. 'Peltigera malacea cyanobiont' DB3992]
MKDESGNLYLATCLTRKNPQGQIIKSTSVPASFIHNIMNDSRCKRQVIILDCCFSGAFAQGWSAKDDGSVDIQTQLGGEGELSWPLPLRFSILSSNRETIFRLILVISLRVLKQVPQI